MTICPICKSPAGGGHQGTGDFKQFNCPRCGMYQITGTALEMLSSRLAADEEKVGARLSHAVRSLAETTSDGTRPEINSVNLDELSKRSLPSIQRQEVNLLRWAEKSLEDDQLGNVTLPEEHILASIVGALNGDRANKLVSLAEKDGLIALGVENRISVTEKGWSLLEPVITARDAASETTDLSKLAAEVQIVKSHCNKCKGERNAYVRATHTVDGNDDEVSWSNRFDVLECCGCETISIRHEYWFSEWDTITEDEMGNIIMKHGVKTKYWPPPIRRTKPEWSTQISDETLRVLFDELYIALDSGLLVFSTMGARTLFDRASFLQVGDPKGGFAGKLKVMQANGHISVTEKNILLAMTDAGSASAHRGYSPTFEQLTAIIDILENYIQRSFILTGAADELRKSTPPRT